jgi:hypothetical protein
LYLIILIITIFAGIRGEVGTDTLAYHEIYTEFLQNDFQTNIRSFEPGFIFLCYMTSFFSLNVYALTFSISLMQMYALCVIVKKTNKPIHFLLIYISLFYLNLEFNILRSGISVLFLVCASLYINSKSKNFYLYGFCSIIFHYSSLIGFIPLIFLLEISKIFFGFSVPYTINELLKFSFVAFVLGYFVDIFIYKFQVFGKSLNKYYEKYGYGFFGAMAFLFSIVTSFFIMKLIFKIKIF